MLEIIKNGSEEMAAVWDRLHDPRRVYKCDRCGCEWKCEYMENCFGPSHEYNGDPAILCPQCGCDKTREKDYNLNIPTQRE